MIPEDRIRKTVNSVNEQSADAYDAWFAGNGGGETSRAYWKRRALAAEAELASRLPRQDDEIRKAALEEAAKVAEARFTDASVPKNRKGKPYLSGDVAIWTAETIAAAIRALSQKGEEA